MLEPITTASDSAKPSSPAFTRAITMMMVTDEESMAMVAAVPVSTPVNRFRVKRASPSLRRFPDKRFSASDNRVTA